MRSGGGVPVRQEDAPDGTPQIRQAAAGQLAFQQVPSSGTAGQPLGAIQVAVEDAYGNLITDDTSTVTLSVATGPGSFAAGSTLSVAAMGGIATFSNVTFNTSGNYTLYASEGLLNGVTSSTITVSVSSAAAVRRFFSEAHSCR